MFFTGHFLLCEIFFADLDSSNTSCTPLTVYNFTCIYTYITSLNRDVSVHDQALSPSVCRANVVPTNFYDDFLSGVHSNRLITCALYASSGAC